MYKGPSEPRSVVVRVGFNSEVCATWVQPALPVGTIILYNLYAEVVENSVEAVDVVDLPSNTAVKVGDTAVHCCSAASVMIVAIKGVLTEVVCVCSGEAFPACMCI